MPWDVVNVDCVEFGLLIAPSAIYGIGRALIIAANTVANVGPLRDCCYVTDFYFTKLEDLFIKNKNNIPLIGM